MDKEPSPSEETPGIPDIFAESEPPDRNYGRRYYDEILRQNIERYRELFERVNDVVYNADATGHFTLFNPAALNLLQYSAEELLGRHYSSFIHPDYRRAVTTFYRRQFARRIDQTIYEYPAVRKDGQTLWFEQNVHLRVEKGEVTGFLAIARDITERKKAEQRLSIRHAVTQLLTEEPSIERFISDTLKIIGQGLGWQFGAYWQVESDDIGVPILHCIKTWRRGSEGGSDFEMGSYEQKFRPEEGLPGRTMAVGKPLWLVDICSDPALYPRAEYARQDGLHGGFAFPVSWDGKVQGVFEFFGREAQQPDEDLLVTATTISHQIGQIHARKLAELEVRRSEGRKAGILESSLDAIVGMDINGKVTEWNKAAERIFGYSREEALEQDLATLMIPEEVRALHYAGIQNFLKTGKGIVFDNRLELTAVRSNGEEFPVELIVTIVEDEETPSFTGFIRDISERKQAESTILQAREEAEAANQAKSEFLSRMSHELRTPLNGILGFAQVLQMDELSNDQSDMLGHIVTAGNHLLALINEVLDISAIDTGHISVSIEPVYLSEVVISSLDLIAPLAHRRQITVHRPDFMEEESKFVLADYQRLGQVLLNLLSNAVKYNSAGGEITVRCEERETNILRLSVSDTGDGLTPEKIEQLFQPFNRLGAERTPTEGTGLGLALTKRLVEAMKGTIGVESEPGKGATFWIEFPVVRAEPQSAEQPEDSVTGSNEQTGGTVLYIEDNLSNLKLIEHLIQKRDGVRLVVAMQGGIGFDLARQHRPDLILLDQNLPDIIGYEVLKRLKNDELTCDIPVVILSADATQKQIEQCLSEGAIAYLTKPINVAKFLKLIDEYLNRTVASSDLV